jgi:glycosyltransferase involved in cell wall biosynthesis
VIIAYNEEQYIGKLLESIRAQDWPKYEVILVDDHSTDRTVEVANSFASLIPLKIVQKDIRGASRSRNYGETFAEGEVILFLDADVIMPGDFISKTFEVFREQRLSIAGVGFIPLTENKVDKLIAGIYRAWLLVVQYFNPRGIGFCLFVHNQLHKKVLFDEAVVMSEDFDYVRRAVQYGKFRIINSIPVKVSWRRFHQENRFLLVLKYLFFEWYRQHIGEIRKKLLPYEFGGSR